MTMKIFINTAKPLTKENSYSHSSGAYGFDRTPILLFEWSRLFQRVVSQSLTYKFTGKFHDQECGIYKSEGGCSIPGINDLVLREHHCSFDYGRGKADDKKVKECADFITKVVLEWNPMDPILSMLESARQAIGYPGTLEEFKEKITAGSAGGIFGGNALSSFFNWNPFSDPPIDRDYERDCLTVHSEPKLTDAEVDQQFADEDLGKELKDLLDKKIRQSNPSTYLMCCSPRREKGVLRFWVNTGRSTQIDHWQTEKSLREFLKTDGKLIEK